ncbi:MAG TPA: S8/S53 family peptidase, partial [Ktedonobacteraceae bacterium]|nr:S8/S53 family peptidase [Ktedonobacteraceae bacterium]
FPMNDHGVFIAGIIRDIAPGTQVECIRVLNDYCVGDTTTLINALSLIQSRLLPDGDLYNTPVVVNMSLTATPSEEGLASLGLTDVSIAPARIGLLLLMQTLGQQGVVFAASSGNGSGPHDKITNPPGERVQPRFPAAFAYPLPGAVLEYPDLPAMIPVGAVDSLGAAASYSNYPGLLGIGTYGGEIPQSGKYDPATGTQAQPPIDAPCGIYTSILYPALSVNDPLPIKSPAPVSYPEYEPSPVMTWAYWSGTSFATPVISALAARVMETQPSVGDSVRQALLNAAPAQVDWTNMDTGQSDAWGPLIMVSQVCTNGESE